MFVAAWKTSNLSAGPTGATGAFVLTGPPGALAEADAVWASGGIDFGPCDLRYTNRRLSQKHSFERNATSIMLTENKSLHGRWTRSLRHLALTIGMILAMAFGGGMATARSVDGRGVAADASANSILLASASSSTFDAGGLPTIDYPPEWFVAAPRPALGQAEPDMRTLVVWHGAPRVRDAGPSLIRLGTLLLASTLALAACMLLGRRPARRRV